MSEKKKTVELKDEQLEKVIGGKEQVKTQYHESVQGHRDDGACGSSSIDVNKDNECLSYNVANSTCRECKYRPGCGGNSHHNDFDDEWGGKYNTPFH